MRHTFPLRLLAPLAVALPVLAGCGGGDKVMSPPTYCPPTSPPVVQSVNGATLPSGTTGSTVIVEGLHFGGSSCAGQLLFSDGAGGTVAATVVGSADWTDTYIVATVPAGASTGDVIVQTSAGTSQPLRFTITQNAAFSPSTIAWQPGTALPAAVSGHAAVFAVVKSDTTLNVAYVIGGADSTNVPDNSVWFARVGADGSLDAWQTAAALPESVAFAAACAATSSNARIHGSGYVYVLGGMTPAEGATPAAPTSAVYRGSLNADGSIGGWTVERPLPVPLDAHRCVVFHGDLYVAGGATTGGAPVASVYRARIDSTGALGAWAAQPGMPSPRAFHGLTAFGGYLYAFGGETGASDPNDGSLLSDPGRINSVISARINLLTGDLEPAGWTLQSASMIKSVSKQTTTAAGGYVLASGGLYNGASSGATEESYSQFLSGGSLGSFNGATGSHTIESAGGANLFNQAALSYVDADGLAHVMVLGGDDVNAPGHKHAEVWIY